VNNSSTHRKRNYWYTQCQRTPAEKYLADELAFGYRLHFRRYEVEMQQCTEHSSILAKVVVGIFRCKRFILKFDFLNNYFSGLGYKWFYIETGFAERCPLNRIFAATASASGNPQSYRTNRDRPISEIREGQSQVWLGNNNSAQTLAFNRKWTINNHSKIF
jgi:hypothetical protein